MSGRLGGVKVVIMPNRDHVEGDAANSHTHILYFQDGMATAPRPADHTAVAPPERTHKAGRPDTRQRVEDDPVPF
jgi:hypothetical protein